MRAPVSQGSMTLDNPIHLEQEFSLDGDDGEEFNDDERAQSSDGGKKRATRNQPSWFLPEIPTPPPSLLPSAHGVNLFLEGQGRIDQAHPNPTNFFPRILPNLSLFSDRRFFSPLCPLCPSSACSVLLGSSSEG